MTSAGDACRSFAGASLGLNFDNKAKKDPLKDTMNKAVATTENFLGDFSADVEKYQELAAQQNQTFMKINNGAQRKPFDVAVLLEMLDAGILSSDTIEGLAFLAKGENLKTFDTFSNTLTTQDPSKQLAAQNAFIKEFAC